MQEEPFWGCSWIGGSIKTPLIKICHTYPKMMKLGTVIAYQKKIQKIYKPHDTATFVISGNTDIDCILIHNF